MKELVEEIMNHCDGIIERSERMTSGNYMHNCAANKVSAKIIKSCVNNLVSGIQWQKGKPKEEGYYLVTFIQIKSVRKIKRKKGKDVVRYIEVEEALVHPVNFHPKYGWEEINEVIAWCKLSDIAPYKEEKK